MGEDGYAKTRQQGLQQRAGGNHVAAVFEQLNGWSVGAASE